jgi:uncharacterized protein
MKRVLLSWLALALFMAGPVAAQTYPDPASTTINDFAGLLSPEAETEIGAELAALREETGVEMTVVTLSRKDMFAPNQTLEQFAGGLFDQWGIGNKTRNDGVLFLVLHSDREVRIELGEAYGQDWQIASQAVIDRSVLPAFGEDRYEDGIRTGVRDTIETVVKNHLAGAEAAKIGSKGEGSGVSGWWAAIIFVPIGLMILWSKLKSKLTKCPQCGNRGVTVTNLRLEEPTQKNPGRGEQVTECEKCGYRHATPYTIAALDTPGGKDNDGSTGFGGGSSGGGGASGKW